MCCTWLAENTGRKKSLKIRHLGTIVQHFRALTTKAGIDNWKKLVKQQYLLHMSPQCGELGPLTAELGLPVWGIPANFNVFRVLPSLLQCRRSPEANQLRVFQCRNCKYLFVNEKMMLTVVGEYF